MNTLLSVGVAVNVTVLDMLAEQVVPQLMPAGELVTVPVPGPDFSTETVYVGAEKYAVTSLAASMVTMHVPVPLHAPFQPWKVAPNAGTAYNSTSKYVMKGTVQLTVQFNPGGALLTVPKLEVGMETVRDCVTVTA